MIGYTPTPDFYNDYIAHYGVPGMKWGVRKAPQRVVSNRVRKAKKSYLLTDLQKKKPSKSKKDYEVKTSKRDTSSDTSKKMEVSKSDSSVTKKVKNDWNNMDDSQFRAKYKVSKKKYEQRVNKYGDPYMNSPLAKYAKNKKKRSSRSYLLTDLQKNK